MKISHVLFFLLFTSLLFSQEFHSKLKLTSDSDTIFWKKYKDELVKKYDLGFIESNKSNVVFRFWTFGRTIEISKKENRYYGNLSFFVKENSKNSNKIFKKVYPLENNKCLAIVKLIDSTKINSIPSDKLIKKWHHGLDGITYFIETKSDKEYSFKNYWEPSEQKEVSEAIRIERFINKLYEISEMEEISKQFDNEIPFQGYTFEGSGIVRMRVLNKED